MALFTITECIHVKKELSPLNVSNPLKICIKPSINMSSASSSELANRRQIPNIRDA